MYTSRVSFNASLNNNNIKHNSYQNSKVTNNSNRNEQESKFSTKSCVCSVIALATLTGGLYIAGKEGYLGSAIKNKLAKGTKSVTLSGSNAAENIERANANVKDILSYAIKPPKISDIQLKKTASETNMEFNYRKIAKDINRDNNTQKRFEEIKRQLDEDNKNLYDKLEEIGVVFNNNGINGKNEIHENSIYQKRYFSLPESDKAKGHSCLDPLLYQKPREEIIDLQLGYRLLEPLNEIGKRESDVLNGLRGKVQISPEDRNFVDECINKMSKDDAHNYGEYSVIRASEHQRLGKIFREALGISVR